MAGCSSYLPPEDFVSGAWSEYRRLYVHPEGYVVDITRDEAPVISEAQGYSMLRAVWEGDEPTFRALHRWTRGNLLRPDGLHSWLWSPGGAVTLPPGGAAEASEGRAGEGVLRGAGEGEDGPGVVDANTATDADQEIAWALILAAHRFDDPGLLDEAEEILRSIRTHARLEVPGGWFPSAGNWANRDRVVNLSYFIPYAYPYFQRLDPEGRWDRVHTVGYDLIGRVLGSPEVSLVPDFMTVSVEGQPEALPSWVDLSEDFSFDAMRLFWRVALDCDLHGTPAACADPLDSRSALPLLGQDGTYSTRYTVAGEPLAEGESPSFFASLLPALDQTDPRGAAWIRDQKLDGWMLHDLLTRPDRYWDQNWVWFGLAVDEGWLQARTPPPETVLPGPTR